MKNKKSFWFVIISICVVYSVYINVCGISKYTPYCSFSNEIKAYIFYDNAFTYLPNNGRGDIEYHRVGNVIKTGSQNLIITPFSFKIHGVVYVNWISIVAQLCAIFFIVVGTAKIIQINRYGKKEGEEK